MAHNSIPRIRSGLLVHYLWWSVLATSILAGCASRYRLPLLLTADEVTRKVKVEETTCFRGSVLNDPDAREKILSGPGNVVRLTIGTRGKRNPALPYSVLAYDEYMKLYVYLQLAENPRRDTIPLVRNSFVQLLERYEQSPQDKIFRPESGDVVVDSIVSKRLFGTIRGEFKNPKGAPISLDGRFSVKIVR